MSVEIIPVSDDGSFRDVEIADNALLIFPGQVVNAGLPVRCEAHAFADRLFAL